MIAKPLATHVTLAVKLPCHMLLAFAQDGLQTTELASFSVSCKWQKLLVCEMQTP